MDKNSKIVVLGAGGLVGKSLIRNLKGRFENVISLTRADLDLSNQIAVDQWFETNKPEYVFLAAAKVGGIVNNSRHPADFGYENGILELNVIHSCHKYKVTKMLFLGSACIYPKETAQPIKESYLLSSSLEPTNEMYALAKIYGLRLCQAYKKQYGCNFISCMPANLYGIEDNFSLEGGHVIPATLRKFHEAKLNKTDVTCFGSGNIYREFLYVDDLAKACIFLMENYNDIEPINIGYGEDITIKNLMELMRSVIGFPGEIKWDSSKPDGVLRRLLDSSKIFNMGWKPNMSLEEGLTLTYKWFVECKDKRL